MSASFSQLQSQSPSAVLTIAGLHRSARYQGKPLQTDHGVPSPIGKPMIARDDGADFVSGGAGAGRFGNPFYGPHYELVGGQHRLCRRASQLV
jgi:hypothetical protein